MTRLSESLQSLKQVLDAKPRSEVSTGRVVQWTRPPPATRDEVIQLLGRLSLHYPPSGLDEARETLRWEDYLEDLKRFSVEEIKGMCDGWRRSDERFFPTPGQLRKKR